MICVHSPENNKNNLIHGYESGVRMDIIDKISSAMYKNQIEMIIKFLKNLQ